MDFNSLIHVAQKNDNAPKKEIKYYSTKFEPPKKEERTKQLSDNIKKFLARKEAEEKKKAKEAKIKKEELLALRSQDKKATRRVSVMLKRTKSANKSVLEDAVDNDNTAVTLAGPSQPDEDDYGYVSQEASAFYNKMMAKYSTMPEEPKLFSSSKKNVNVNLSGTKDRVRAALLKEQEEAMLPHRRKRKSKHDDGEEERETRRSSPETVISESNTEKPAKPKPKPIAPPALNFQDLLKLAEKKQFEPIMIEPKKIPEEDEHPMTKRQRREFEKEKAWKEHREKRREAMENERISRLENRKNGIQPEKRREGIDERIAKPESSKNSMPPPNRIPKLNNSCNNLKIPKLSNPDDHLKNSQKPMSYDKKPVPDRKAENYKLDLNKSSKLKTELEKPRDSNKYKPQTSLQINQNRGSSSSKPIDKQSKDIIKTNDTKKVPRRDVDIKEFNKSRVSLPMNSKSKIAEPQSKLPGKSKQIPSSEMRLKPSSSSDIRQKQISPANVRPKQLPSSNIRPKQFPPDIRPKQFPPADVRPKQFPPTDVRPKQFPPADVRPKQFPPADVRPKQFPPADIRPKQFPPADVRRKPPAKKPPMGHKRRILDDDSEYDSEMDDFIDDDPEEGEDYSKYISEIFGYDKNKYRDIPEDDDRMESSFSQMMREEFISSKIGLMEDLEDMKQEALEKKQKAARKKQIMRR